MSQRTIRVLRLVARHREKLAGRRKACRLLFKWKPWLTATPPPSGWRAKKPSTAGLRCGQRTKAVCLPRARFPTFCAWQAMQNELQSGARTARFWCGTELSSGDVLTRRKRTLPPLQTKEPRRCKQNCERCESEPSPRQAKPRKKREKSVIENGRLLLP